MFSPNSTGPLEKVQNVSNKTVKTRGQLAKEKRLAEKRKAEEEAEAKRASRRAIKHASDARKDQQVIIEDIEPKRKVQVETARDLLNVEREKKYAESMKKKEKQRSRLERKLGKPVVFIGEEVEAPKVTLKPKKFMIDEEDDPLWTLDSNESSGVNLKTTMTQFTLSEEAKEGRQKAGVKKAKDKKRDEKKEEILEERKTSRDLRSRTLRQGRIDKSFNQNLEWHYGSLHGVEVKNVKDSKKKVRARKHNEHPVEEKQDVEEPTFVNVVRPFTKNQVHDFRAAQKEKRMQKHLSKETLKVSTQAGELDDLPRLITEEEYVQGYINAYAKPKDSEDDVEYLKNIITMMDKVDPYLKEGDAILVDDVEGDFDLEKYYEGCRLMDEYLDNLVISNPQSNIVQSMKSIVGQVTNNKTVTFWLKTIVQTVRLLDALLTPDLALRFKQDLFSYYIQSFGVSWFQAHCASTLFVMIMKLIPKDTPKRTHKDQLVVTPQSLSAELDKVGDILEYVFDSAFSDAVKTLLIYGAYSQFFTSYETAMAIYRWCGAPPKGLSVLSIFEQVVKAFANIVRAFEALADGASFNEAFFLKDPYVANSVKASELLMQKEHFFAGIEAEGKFCRYQWIEDYKSVIKYLRERRDNTSTAKPQYMTLSRLITSLEAANAEVQNSLDGGFRPAPISVVIGEDPGIGKGQLIDLIAATIVHEYYEGKQPYNPDMVFHRPMNSEFMDGYSNQPIIHYSEAGRETAEIAKMGKDEVLPEHTSVVDNQPMLANMAFADKGKKYVRFIGVVTDTNNLGMNLVEKVHAVAAYQRRHIYCKFTVLDQFRKEGGCGLDWKKAQANTTGGLDLYSIDMWTMDAKNVKKAEPKLICQGANIYVFTAALRNLIRNHFDGQKYVQEMRKDNKIFDVFNDLAKPGQKNDKYVKTPIDGITNVLGGFIERAKEYVQAKEPIDQQEVGKFIDKNVDMGPKPGDEGYEQFVVERKEVETLSSNIKFPVNLPKSNLPYSIHMLPQIAKSEDLSESSHVVLGGVNLVDNNLRDDILKRAELPRHNLFDDDEKGFKLTPTFEEKVERNAAQTLEELKQKQLELSQEEYKEKMLPVMHDIEFHGFHDRSLKFDNNGRKVTPQSGILRYFQTRKKKDGKKKTVSYHFVELSSNLNQRPEDEEDYVDIVDFTNEMKREIRNDIWPRVPGRFKTALDLIPDAYLDKCFAHILINSNIFYRNRKRIMKIEKPRFWKSQLDEEVFRQVAKHVSVPEFTLDLIEPAKTDCVNLEDNCGNSVGVIPQLSLPIVHYDVPFWICVKHDLKWLGTCVVTTVAAPVGGACEYIQEGYHSLFFKVVQAIVFAILYGVMTFFSPVLVFLPFAHLFTLWKWPSSRFSQSVKNAFKDYGMRLYQRRKIIAYITGTVGAAAVMLTTCQSIRAYWKTKKKTTTYVKSQGALYSLETLTNCGPGIVRVDTKSVKGQWNEVMKFKAAPTYTGTPESLFETAMESTRYFHLRNNKNDTVQEGYLFGIHGRDAIVPSHYFHIGDEFWMECFTVDKDKTKSKKSASLHLTKKDLRKFGGDLVVFDTIRINFRNLKCHVLNQRMYGTNGSAIFNWEKVTWEQNRIDCLNDNEKEGEDHFAEVIPFPIEHSYATVPGMCGLPIIMSTGQGAFIGGIHVAGAVINGVNKGIAEPLILCEYENAQPMLKALTQDRTFFTALSEPEDMTLSGIQPFPLSKLELPHPKSPFSHEPFDNLTLLGTLPVVVNVNNKSNLQKSIFADRDDFIEEFAEAFEKYPSQFFGKPMMKPTMVNGEFISPISINLRKANVKKQIVNRDLMFTVIEKMVEHIDEKLCKSIPKEGLTPWNSDVALNGCTTDEFFGAIKWSTAAGFGFGGTKADWTNLDVDTRKRTLKPEVEQLVFDLALRLKEGYFVKFVHTASLKDEARAIEKCAKGKTRVFFVTPLSMLVLSRMYLSPILSFMVSDSEAFDTAIGINMHRESDALYRKMSEFSDLHMTGDYSGYDVSMPPEVSIIAYTVLFRLLKKYGYNEDAMKIVGGLMCEFFNLHISYNADIVFMQGITASGQSSTAELNSVKAKALIYMGWYSHPKLKNLDIRDHVLLKTFGDDLWAAVKAIVAEYFNNVYYSQFIASLGLEYTNAQKGQVEEPFCSGEDVSFLKRSFREHPVLKHFVGQLDYNSLYKMLYFTMPSNVVNPAEQMKMTIDSFLRESFFHLDEAHYSRLREYVSRVYESEYGLPASVSAKHFHSYEKLCEEYKSGVKDTEMGAVLVTTPQSRETSATVVETVRWLNIDAQVVFRYAFMTCACRIKTTSRGSIEQNLRELKSKMEEEVKELQYEVSQMVNPFPGVPLHKVMSMPGVANSACRAQIEDFVTLHQRIDACLETIKFCDGKLRTLDAILRVSPQSAEVGLPSDGMVDNDEKVENVVDVGGEQATISGAGYSYSMTKPTTLIMEDYLERWVDLTSITIPISTRSYNTIDPWSLVVNDPTYRAKLRNFAFMRADLEVKISISASSMHYGKVLVAYIPMPTDNEISNFYVNTATVPYDLQKLCWLTQQPGTKIMDVGDNQPLEMSIPYVGYNPMVRLFNPSSNAVIAGNFPDVSYLGRLLVLSMNYVACVSNTAATAITVQVYGRLKNVELMQTTGTQLVVTTESGELKQGVYEKMSSTAADMSHALSVVPTVGPAFKASEYGFRALQHIFALLGWSVPMVIPSENKPMHIRNDAYQNAVNTISYCTGKKMTFDPLQELSPDPSIVGNDEDELALQRFFKTMSYLDTVSWGVGNTTMTSIWSCAVSPYANKVGPIAALKMFVQPTSVAFAAKPFKYWHGTMVYTFQIVRSAFHRGKLAVLFDPNIAQYTLITSTLHLNKQNLVIVDIQDTTTFEVCVHWAQSRYWLQQSAETDCNRMVGSALNSSIFTNADCVNGFITVFPFTQLQCPDGTAVQVNVFVSAPDLKVNQIKTEDLPTLRATTQSGELFPLPQTCFEMNEPVLDEKYASLYHFGEQPVSFRSYLHRYFTSATFTVVGPTNTGYRFTGTVMPTLANPFGGAGGVTMDLLSWLRYSYLGFKGSLRKRAFFNGQVSGILDSVKVTQPVPATSITANAFVNVAPINMLCSHTGTATFMPSTNSGIEVEIPMYSMNLFWPAGLSTITSTTNPMFQTFNAYNYTVTASFAGTGANLYFAEETCFGDDATLFRFLGASPYTTASY